MKINELRQDDIIVLKPIGRINNDTSADFQTSLLGWLGAAASKVLIDFAGVDYVSSAGLRALMMAAKQAKATNGRLAVAALTPMVKEIFAISRFALVVQVFETGLLQEIRGPQFCSTQPARLARRTSRS